MESPCSTRVVLFRFGSCCKGGGKGKEKSVFAKIDGIFHFSLDGLASVSLSKYQFERLRSIMDPAAPTQSISEKETQDASSQIHNVPPSHQAADEAAKSGNFFDFMKPADMKHTEKEPEHETKLEKVVGVTAPRRSSSSSAEEVELSREPEMVSRMNTLSGAAIDFSSLDVNDPNFDAKEWVKVTLRTADKTKLKYRRATFAFKDLDVSGSASGGRNIQATVASVLTSPLSFRKYFNLGKHAEKTILSQFDGVVKSGEMLLVLGRPGSGCSTFLRTIGGQLAGLKVSPSSHIDYNGMRFMYFRCAQMVVC